MAPAASKFVIADVETSGFRPRYDDVIRIDALRVDNKQSGHRLRYLIRCRKPLRPEVESVTGITNEMLERGAKPPADAAKGFLNFIGEMPLVISYAEFVVPFLNGLVRKAGRKIVNPMSCTHEMAKQIWPGRTTYGTAAVISYLAQDGIAVEKSGDELEITKIIYLALLQKVGSGR